LTNAILPSLGTGNDTAYLWDLYDSVKRFVLLNQTDVVTTLSWNVTQQLELNQTNLNWATLPANVQLFLQQELAQNQFANLTFLSWGWTDSNNTFANTTLFSLFTSQGQQNLPVIRAILVPLTFSSVLNTTLLTQGYRRMRPTQAVKILDANIQGALPFKPFPEPPRNGRHRQPRAKSPYDIINAVLNRAAFTIRKCSKSNGIN